MSALGGGGADEEEPPTTGRVVLQTTYGPVEVELWCKEAPLACRNFIQLALEGYYDGTTFHRLVRSFIIQGGDPTGRGDGGDSVYGAPFALEAHPKLKFTRRGLLAMVAVNDAKEAASQFFITLGPAPHLYREATLFGRVIGDTIYNVVRMSELELEEGLTPDGAPSDRILYPPVVSTIGVLLNPFDDIVPRPSQRRGRPEAAPLEEQLPAAGGPAKQRSTATRMQNKRMLSFLDDEEDGDGGLGRGRPAGRVLSSHEALDDPTLSKATPQAPLVVAEAPASTTQEQGASQGELQGASQRELQRLRRGDIDEVREKIAKVRAEMLQKDSMGGAPLPASAAGTGDLGGGKEGGADAALAIARRQSALAKVIAPSRRDEEPAAGGYDGDNDAAVYKERTRAIAASQRRRRAAPGRSGAADEMDTLLALAAFRDKLARLDTSDPTALALPPPKGAAAPSAPLQLEICKLHGLVGCESCHPTFAISRRRGDPAGAPSESGGPAEESGWLMHRLVLDKTAGYRRMERDLDDLVIIDPRRSLAGDGGDQAAEQ